jgi:hypothetical protein
LTTDFAYIAIDFMSLSFTVCMFCKAFVFAITVFF